MTFRVGDRRVLTAEEAGFPVGTSGNSVAQRVVGITPDTVTLECVGPVILVLPEPPAANKYLRTHGHVTYKTREAKAYCQRVSQLAQTMIFGRFAQGIVFPTGDVSVSVVWFRGRKAGDLGERTKCLYDALQGTVYTDDKQIAHDERWRVDAHPSIPKGHVRVEVSAL